MLSVVARGPRGVVLNALQLKRARTTDDSNVTDAMEQGTDSAAPSSAAPSSAAADVSADVSVVGAEGVPLISHSLTYSACPISKLGPLQPLSPFPCLYL